MEAERADSDRCASDEADGTVLVCRARSRPDEQTTPLVVGLVVGAFAGAFWITSWYMSSVSSAKALSDVEVEYDTWVVLVAAVAAYAVAGGVIASTWLMSISWLCDPRPRRQDWVRWVGSIACIGVVVIGSLFLMGASESPEGVDVELASQTRPVTVAVAVASLPGLAGFVLLRSIAAHDTHWREPDACRLMMIVRLRRELQRLLSLFALQLTLLVVATGMRRRMLLQHDANLDIPIEQVLLYGLSFAALLGVAFGVAKSAIDGRARRIVDDVAPVVDPRGDDFSAALNRRSELEGMLRLGQDTRQTFESTVAIAAPLVAALIGAAIT